MLTEIDHKYLDTKFDAIYQVMDVKLQAVETLITKTANQTEKRFDEIKERLENHNNIKHYSPENCPNSWKIGEHLKEQKSSNKKVWHVLFLILSACLGGAVAILLYLFGIAR